MTRAPQVPPPLPITTAGTGRKSLLWVPAEIGRSRSGIDWLTSFDGSRRDTPTGRASRPTIRAIVDPEDQLVEVFRAEGIRPGPKGRDGREPRGAREGQLIERTQQRASDEIQGAFYGRDTGPHAIKFVHPAVILAPEVPIDFRERAFVSPELFVRVAAARYDEVIILVRESRSRGVIRRWARARRTWIVVFPEPLA